MIKYEVLYSIVREKGNLLLRLKDYPAKIAIPKAGYAVHRADLTYSSVEQDDKKAFEEAVDNALKINTEGTRSLRYLLFKSDAGLITVYPVDIFKDIRFAMGVAWERRADGVIDLSTNEKIWVQQ